MKPLIAGLVFVGGILVLLFSSDEEDSEKKDELNDKNTNSPEGEKVNVEEIRRLRRELRHQMKMKKKSTPNKPPSKQ